MWEDRRKASVAVIGASSSAVDAGCRGLRARRRGGRTGGPAGAGSESSSSLVVLGRRRRRRRRPRASGSCGRPRQLGRSVSRRPAVGRRLGVVAHRLGVPRRAVERDGGVAQDSAVWARSESSAPSISAMLAVAASIDTPRMRTDASMSPIIPCCRSCTRASSRRLCSATSRVTCSVSSARTRLRCSSTWASARARTASAAARACRVMSSASVRARATTPSARSRASVVVRSASVRLSRSSCSETCWASSMTASASATAASRVALASASIASTSRRVPRLARSSCARALLLAASFGSISRSPCGSVAGSPQASTRDAPTMPDRSWSRATRGQDIPCLGDRLRWPGRGVAVWT